MTRRFQFSLIVLTMLATASCSPPIRAPGTYAYRLDGNYYEDHGPQADPPANNLYGWPILEMKFVADQDLANELQASLENQGNSEDRNTIPGCFWPGFAIAIDDGEHSTEAIICLKCDYVWFFRDGTRWKGETVTDRGHQEFGKLYARAFPDQPKP